MKLKKLMASLIAGIVVLSICAIPAMAKQIPVAPNQTATLDLQALNEDGTECQGDVTIGGSAGFNQLGDYYALSAQSQDGYVFSNWTLDLSLEKANGTSIPLGANYSETQNGNQVYAFSNGEDQTPCDTTSAKIKVNYVTPAQMEQGDILRYTAVANYEKTVNVKLNAFYNDHLLETSNVYFGIGQHQVPIREEELAQVGFKLIDPSTNPTTVTVTEDAQGNLVADPSEVNFYVEPTEDPSTFSFDVNYVDANGNPLFSGGKIYFDEVGPYSSENIPLPYGYKRIIPAHPGADYLYPTSLEFIDGTWQVTNPTVEISVAKSVAVVNVKYALEDGTLLTDLGYEKPYFEVGAGIETVEAPEGYEIVGDNTFAVDVTEDALGNLQVDPTEVTFTVKPVQQTVPANPETPKNDGQNTNNVTGNPTTGDTTTYVALAVTAVAAAGVVLVTLKKKKA